MTDKDTRLLFEQYIVSENRKDNIQHLLKGASDDYELKLKLHALFKKMYEDLNSIRSFAQDNNEKISVILQDLYDINEHDNATDLIDKELLYHITGVAENLKYIGEEISENLGYHV